MATRFPLNPEELEQEEHVAEEAIHEEEVQRHAAWVQRHEEGHADHQAAPADDEALEFQVFDPWIWPKILPECPLTSWHALCNMIQMRAGIGKGKGPHERLRQVPGWREQLTARGMATGCVLGTLFCVVVLKLFLGPGIIPSLNIAAGLLAFCALHGWAWAAGKLGWAAGGSPVGAQETNVVQTFVTACCSVAYTGGFGNYLTAMDRRSYEQLGGDTVTGNRPQDVFEPTLTRIVPYLLSTSVIGVFMLVGLRKLMIIDYALTFPSGTATGLMIDSFFTRSGAATAGKQLSYMARFFALSLTWSGLKWLVSGENCSFCSDAAPCGGFERLPVFGMAAARWTFFLNLTVNIIGAGMICPHSVNLSLLLGACLTWGLLWPWITSKEGAWYPAGLGDKSFSGLFGYKVFITISLIMGDGLYNLGKVLYASIAAYVRLTQEQRYRATASGAGHSHLASATVTAVTGGQGGDGSSGGLGQRHSSTGAGFSVYGSAEGGWHVHSEDLKGPGDANGQGKVKGPRSGDSEGLTQPLLGQGQGGGDETEEEAAPHAAKESRLERALRTRVFTTDVIPAWLSVSGYLAFGVMGTFVIPLCYPVVKWYYVVIGFLTAPMAALPVSFGCGLTDWDVSSQIGQLAIFLFAAWAGVQGGGVVVGLAMAGVMLAATSTCATLMQDFRTGYIVKCAPKAMFAAQVLGALAGALLAPLTFALFWATGKVGDPSGPYPNPYGTIYRAMAVFGTQGLGVLPRHCAPLMACALALSLLLNAARDTLPSRYARFVPLPMAMAIPCVLGAYIAIDMSLGSLILAVWEYLAPASAELLAPALASGLIVGDGVAAIPISLFGMLGISPPMCLAIGSTTAAVPGA